MLLREVAAFYSENGNEFVNTFYVQITKFINVNGAEIYSGSVN
jgi:hypothetical protein